MTDVKLTFYNIYIYLKGIPKCLRESPLKFWIKKLLTCSWVKTLLEDPVISALSFKKCEIRRRSSLRFMPSKRLTGTKRSRPNSRLK